MDMKSSILDKTEWKWNADEEEFDAFCLPASVMRDSRISCKAKVVWSYMNSRPKYWDFSAKRIAVSMKEGHQAVQAAMRELIEFKYLTRKRLADGRIRYSLCYNPPLLTVEEAQEVLSHSFPRSFDEELDFICTEEARKLLVEAGVDKAFKSAIEFTKSCNESQLPMNTKTFRSWLGHELRKGA